MYRFLTDALKAVARGNGPSSDESTEQIAERREHWQRERKESEALAAFLRSTELGRRLAPELVRMDTGEDAGHREAVLAPPFLQRQQWTGASNLSSIGTAPVDVWDVHVEGLVFAHHAQRFLSRRTAALLRRAGVPNTGECGVVAAAPVPHAGVVVSSRSHVDPAAPLTASVVGRGSVVSPIPEAGPLPLKLIAFLVERWSRLVAEATSATPSPSLLSPSGLSEHSGDAEERLLAYLRGVLPCHLALLEGNHAAYAEAMQRAGVEGAVRASLRVVFRALISADGRAVSSEVSHTTDPASALPTQAECAALFEMLLLLLRLLHEPTSRARVSGAATGMAAADLMAGAPAAVWQLPTGFPETTTRGSGGRVRAVAAAARARERCGLALDLSCVYLLPLCKGVNISERCSSHEGPGGLSVAEAGPGSSPTPLPSPAGEGGVPPNSVEASLAWCVESIFLLLLPLRVTAADAETMVNVTVTALSVLLARYVSVGPSPATVSADDTGTATAQESAPGSRLLRQASCGLLLATQLLRERPAIVAESMNSAGFFDNLLNTLLCLGAGCASAGSARAADRAASAAQLSGMAGLAALQAARLLSGGRRALERPSFPQLAADAAADEWLHAYLGALAARRWARRAPEVAGSSRLLGYVDQLELALTKVFLVAAAAAAAPAPPTAPAAASDVALVRASAPAAVMSTASQLHPSSCLFDALVTYALECLSPAANEAAALPGLDGDGATQFDRLVDCGLYRVLMVEETFFAAVRQDPRLLHATAFMLQRVLTAAPATTAAASVAPSLDDSAGASAAAVVAVARASERRGVDPAVEALCESLFIGSPAHARAAGGTAASCPAAAFFCAERLWRDAEEGARGLTEEGAVAAARQQFVTVVCALLVGGLGGPRGTAVRAAMVAENVFRLAGHAALALAPPPTDPPCPSSASTPTAPSLACAWVLQVMVELLRQDSVQAHTLLHHADVVLALMLHPYLRADAEKLLVTLLCYHTTATQATVALSAEYVRHMQPMVLQLWGLLSQCENLIMTSVPAGLTEPTALSSTARASATPPPPYATDAVDRDRLFLSLLACIRAAIARLRSGPLRDYGIPVCALQQVLCDPRRVVLDGFVRLVHRVSQPWTPASTATHGLRSVLATLTALVRGEPGMRALLFRTIAPRELVACLRAEWVAACVASGTAVDWCGLADTLLGLVYEVEDEDYSGGGGGEAGSSSSSSYPRVGELRAGQAAASAETAGEVAVGVFGLTCGPQDRSIQNAELLGPLIHCLAQDEEVLFSSGEDGGSAAGALQHVLAAVLHTMRRCRASLFLVSSAGTIGALTQLLPAAALHAKTHGALLELVLDVVKLSASHHIDARRMKQLLMSVVHAPSVEDRAALAPLVIDVISSAVAEAAGMAAGTWQGGVWCGREGGTLGTAGSFASSTGSGNGSAEWPRAHRGLPEPRGYVALRRDSGLPGVRAVLAEFPTEGYSVCMGLRLEPPGAGSQADYRTIFSIQGTDRRTAVELRVTASAGLSVAYLDAQRVPARVELESVLPVGRWLHLVLVHRPPSFLTGVTSTKALTVYVDGELAASTAVVPYPLLPRGYFSVGIPAEDCDQRSHAHALTGQFTSLHLLSASLGAREVGQLFAHLCGAAGGGAGDVRGGSGGAGSSLVSSAGVVASTLADSLNASSSLALAMASSVAAALEETAASLVGTTVDVERMLMDRAVLCIDPRLAESDNRLYNFAAVLRGRQRESVLTTFEGSMVCNTTNARDAVCVLGALPTVVMPFIVLLVNAQLPFSPRGLAPTPGNQGIVATQGSEAAVHRVLRLVEALAGLPAVRGEMVSAGLSHLLAAALEELAPRLGVHVPEHLMHTCATRLIASPALFEAAYMSLFLSPALLHACPPETQLMWVSSQRVAVSAHESVRAAARAAGAQLFVVGELLHILTANPSASGGGGGDHEDPPVAHESVDGKGGDPLVSVLATDASGAHVACDPAQARQHSLDMLHQLLALLEALTGSPVMMSDALAMRHLVAGVHRARSSVLETDLVTVLTRLRLLLFGCEGLLCQLLGRADYAVDLLLLVRSASSAAVRLEALLQLLLLTSRSRRTQELMNPTVLANKGAAHVATDVSLGWLRNVLQPHPVDTPVYMMLRAALVGDYGAREVPAAYAPLRSTDTLSFAPVVGPILTLARRMTDPHLTYYVLTDLLFLLKHDAQAWRKLLTVPAWYVLVLSLYTAELARSSNPAATAGELGDDEGGVTPVAALPSLSEDGGSVDQAETLERAGGVVFSTCAAILAITLSHALSAETYGASEFEAAVTYMQEQGVQRLLSQVLCMICEKLRARLAVAGEASTSNYLGLGSNTALMNVISFVYCAEDVMFYSPHAAPGPGGHLGGAGSSSTSTGATDGHSGAAASTLTAMLGGPPGRTRTGYTEWDALRMVERPAASTEAPTSLSVAGDRRRRILTSPDGHWAHTGLAIKLAELLTCSVALLNYSSGSSGGSGGSGSGSSGNGGGVSVSGSGGGGGGAEAAPSVGSAPSHRRGGFLRIFCRLVRVTAAMTLRDPSSLDAIVDLLDRYVRYVDGAAPAGFLLLKRRTVSLEETKEHSALTVSMTLMYVTHDLLVRRLRAAETLSGTAAHAHVNAALVDRLRDLFTLVRRPLEQLPAFTGSREGDGSNASERYVRRQRTAQWLATRSATTGASADAAAASALLEAFVEIASRTDYNAFIERCILVMERDQLTDKALASEVAAERLPRMTRLRHVIAAHAAALQVVSQGMQRLVGEREETAADGSRSPLPGSAEVALMDTVPPRETAAVVASVARAGVWARFLEAIRGTIWNTESAGPSPAMRYVSLSGVEQQPLLRRKIRWSREGTSHRQVTARMHRQPPPSKLPSPATPPPDSGPDGSGSGDEDTRGSRLRLRGGEAVLLESRGLDEEATLPATEAGGGSMEWAEQWLPQPQQPPLQQPRSGAQSTLPTDEDASTAAAAAAVAGAVPVLLSLPCEVPYLMHCWSATFTLRGGEVCILFDEVNTAYNQQIAEEARPFLARPRNFSFSATAIVQIAPARRFRMKRTALEMWLRDRRSCFVNFADPSVMRLALREVCRVAASRHRRGVIGGGLLFGRRLVAEMAAGLLARQRHGLLSGGPVAAAAAAAAALPSPSPSMAAASRQFYVYQANPLREPLRLHFMQLWQNRELSTFDYLLWLNLLSGRSVNDITQYPVFPWILADYASETLDLSNPATFRDLRRPIGACGDASRREMVHRRYEDMKSVGDVPAHYFTHYSSPAVVIYFMVRLEPYTTLQLVLQGGHFDHPDRMFHSVRAAYRAVTTSTQDTRELTPELYYLPEVCRNGNDVHFGAKQDGTEMGDLQLPPWAHGSPHEFIYLMRAALESDHVSANLHHWIDLIFGASQRGKDAIESLNVFNWHSYEDLDRHRGDAVDEKLLIDSLDNIGQTPIQLFREPHGARRPREIASVFECGLSIKTFYPRLGSCQRIALVSLEMAGRLVLVGGTGVAVSVKLTAQPLRRRTAPGPGGTPLTQEEADGYAYVTARGPELSPWPAPPEGGPTAPAPPFALPPPSRAGGRSPGQAATSAPLSSPRVGAASAAAPRPTSPIHGGFESYSFDVSEEFDRRIAPVPPGVIPHATSRDGAEPGDGPCAADNVALLSFGSASYVVLGGVYDNSVVVRALSGMTEDLRLVAHRGRVVRLAASGDSQFLVTGAEDTTFVVWGCGVGSSGGGRRAALEIELLFTIYGHEDNPTAAQVSSTLDLVATASRDGALMLHSLSSGSLDHALRHPSGHSIDRVLIQSSCYVPNVLYLSYADHIVHQISTNGTPLRTFTPPGRITSWAATSEQFLILTYEPHNRARGLTATPTTGAAEDSDPGAADGPWTPGVTPPSGPATAVCGVLYVHAFYLYVLRSVPLPADTAVQCMAVHPRTPQIVVLGTRACSVLLVRASMQQSTVL